MDLVKSHWGWAFVLTLSKVKAKKQNEYILNLEILDWTKTTHIFLEEAMVIYLIKEHAVKYLILIFLLLISFHVKPIK